MSEAIYRYMTAKGYFQSAFMILRSPDRNDSNREMLTALPMSMLVGFALELYFKSWLLQSGKSSKEVRAYGHKLNKLYADAKLAELPAFPMLEDLVRLFADGHEDFTFRYIEEKDKINLAEWELCFSALDHLDNLVDAHVGASKSHDLLPGH